MGWASFEDGRTIGLTGSEGGVILIDEEHSDGARITLEEGCLRAPFAITCGVYGWLVHTRFMADDETAQHAIGEMKPALAAIAELLPTDDDAEPEARVEAVLEAVSAFTERFP